MPESHRRSAAGPRPVVIGAGPAGLTAAYQLSKHGVVATVLEATEQIGGISQTAVRDGWRFDIGGHRFFTKVSAISDLWHEILGPDNFLTRPRVSRIYYEGKFYDYPLNPWNALSNLGAAESLRCMASYAWARVRPPSDQSTFEGYMAAQFGCRLYRKFFKTYTEKVWGVNANEIRGDWAAQRIRNLSLLRAVVESLLPGRRKTKIASLIEEFKYPRHGPGMMWERCAELVEASGASVLRSHRVTGVHCEGGRAVEVVATLPSGVTAEFACSDVVSSMPFPSLVQAMTPAAPPEVLEAAAGLTYRDFITVALVVPAAEAFTDTWIYIHSAEVLVGRVQNFAAWSPEMIPEAGFTCLGLEYFVFEDDDLWTASDDDLVRLAISELETLELVSRGAIRQGWVVRMPKAYPMYDRQYKQRVDIMRSWLRTAAANVWPVGRNGMHRYNNQDHSMFTAMLAVENIVLDAGHDVWAVNVEAEYHEELHPTSKPVKRSTDRISQDH